LFFFSLKNIFYSSRKFSIDQINELKQVIEEYRHGNYIPLNKGKKNHTRKLILLIVFKSGCL
jgi:hypothetical protein